MKAPNERDAQSPIKPGDIVTVRGTVAQTDDGSAIRIRWYGVPVWVPREAIVDHTPKPAPQCTSMYEVGPRARQRRYVQCIDGEGHDGHHTDYAGSWTWTTSQEYGRVTPRGEQP